MRRGALRVHHCSGPIGKRRSTLPVSSSLTIVQGVAGTIQVSVAPTNGFNAPAGQRLGIATRFDLSVFSVVGNACSRSDSQRKY